MTSPPAGPKVVLCSGWADAVHSINATFGAQLARGDLAGLWLGDEIEAPFANWTAAMLGLSCIVAVHYRSTAS